MNCHSENLIHVIDTLHLAGINSMTDLQANQTLYDRFAEAVTGFVCYFALCSRTHVSRRRGHAPRLISGNQERIRQMNACYGYSVLEDVQSDVIAALMEKADYYLPLAPEYAKNYAYAIVNSEVCDLLEQATHRIRTASLDREVDDEHHTLLSQMADVTADHAVQDHRQLRRTLGRAMADTLNNTARLAARPDQALVYLCCHCFHMKPRHLAQALLDHPNGPQGVLELVLAEPSRLFHYPLPTLLRRLALDFSTLKPDALKLSTGDRRAIAAKISHELDVACRKVERGLGNRF